jgi:hypothetical protein
LDIFGRNCADKMLKLLLSQAHVIVGNCADKMLKLCVHFRLAFIEVDIKPIINIINISFVREKKEKQQ